VKKTLGHLKERGVPFIFHDFKKNGVSETLLNQWLEHVPLDVLINRKGTTWRILGDEQKAMAGSHNTALALLTEQPSLIKRPVVDWDGTLTVGQIEFP
jgi:arsenate reductase